MKKHLPAALVSALLAACGGGDGDSEPVPLLDPPAEGEGFQMSMRTTAPPHTEIWKCQVATLPNRSTASVNRVESIQTPSIHHMDIMLLTLAGVDLEAGTYDCDGLYRDYPELMEEGIFLYASQQPEQSIRLPDGVAANLPPNLTVMYEIHYVNTTAEEVEVESYVNAYTMPTTDVEETIWGFSVRDANLEIPPSARHQEWTRCVMTQDIDLLFLSSHTHELGESVEVRLFDGETPGERIYLNEDWHAPFLKDFGSGMRIPAGTGFEFTCNFANDRAETVEWGFTARDEMCQIGIVFTPGSFDIDCEVVETSDGVLPD